MVRPRIAIYVSLLVITACSGASPKSTQTETIEPAQTEELPGAEDELEGYLDALWALNMRTFPTWATYEGNRAYDDRLADLSEEAHDAYLEEYQAIAAKVEAIDPERLSPMSADTRRMVILSAENKRAREICHARWWQVDGLGGPQVDYPMMPVFHTIRSEEDLENLEARYRATDDQIEQIVENLKKGLQNGYTPTKVNAERAVKQTAELLETPIGEDPMLKIQPTDPDASYETDGLRAAVKEVVRPALKRYRDFLSSEVLPVARQKPGVLELPTGDECYAARMASHIGPGFTAEELHQIGLEELERLHGGMTEVGHELGIRSGGYEAVIEHVIGQEDSYAESEEQLLELNRAAVERAREAVPNFFAAVPETPVEVRPIEPHRAADAPAAYYYDAPEDGSRAAIYYVNTHEPSTRPLFNLEALAYHEAIPGHHFQIAIANELPDVHVWRRNAGQTAFVEGWALYAEKLADEMGLYSSPLTRFGMYNYQAWRAARLVIDTGLHAKGWSRKKAIEFLMENTSLPQNEVENEIDRYIAWPGQALSYMVGRMEIEKMRRAAEDALGHDFDLAAFHGALLGRGAVPLTIMRENMQSWIDQQAESR